jgi:hypothetical protein
VRAERGSPWSKRLNSFVTFPFLERYCPIRAWPVHAGHVPTPPSTWHASGCCTLAGYPDKRGPTSSHSRHCAADPPARPASVIWHDFGVTSLEHPVSHLSVPFWFHEIPDDDLTTPRSSRVHPPRHFDSRRHRLLCSYQSTQALRANPPRQIPHRFAPNWMIQFYLQGRFTTSTRVGRNEVGRRSFFVPASTSPDRLFACLSRIAVRAMRRPS